jgi:hypothetical protein
LREERRLKVFENWVLRRIFGPKRGEVTGEWRKLHNEELNDLLSSPNVIQVIKSITRWAGVCSTYGWRGEVHSGIVMGIPEGKRPLVNPRLRWEDNIKMDLQEVGCGAMDWIDLTEDRDRWRALVNAVINLGIP